MRRATRAVGVVLAGLATVAATTVGTTATTAGAAAGAPGAPAAAAVRASGGFGLAAGSLEALPSAAPSASAGTGTFGQNAGCSYYANNAGMGIYCAGATGDGPTLAELYGSQEAPLCKVFHVPDGMDRPHIELDDDWFWALKGCMSGINWNTISGGPNIRVTMEWTKVPEDETVEEQNSALADILWDMAQENYPMPLVKIEPVAVPRVNTDAIFTFRWVDATENDLPVVQEGPYAERPRRGAVPGDRRRRRDDARPCHRRPAGAPGRGDAPARLRGGPSRLRPRPGQTARPSRARTASSSSPAPARRRRSSPRLSLPEGQEYYFLVRIEVTWSVTIEFAGGQPDEHLGDYQLDTYQQVPVQQSVGTNYSYDD